VPASPFCTVHDPGIGRIHRMVPASSQRTRWHGSDDQPAAVPGVIAATSRMAANDRRRTHVGQPCVTFTPRSAPSRLLSLGPDPRRGTHGSAAG
jgi:hypothetical protein